MQKRSTISRVDYSRPFEKQLKKAPSKIQDALKKRLRIFLDDPYYPQLKNHQLTGKWRGYRSINVSGDWRVIYTEKRNQEESVVLLIAIGTHSQLYG